MAGKPKPPRKSSVSRPPSGVHAAPALHQLAQAALDSYIAVDPKSLKLIDAARRVASTSSIALIYGESGVGKDLLASLIHYLGPSPEQPLVKIDCASLPHDLLESELFGFERGAFTGASQMKRGRFELAANGTIVLDEVSSLSLAMQAKLLRVIEERRFDRLGGSKPIPVNARIIALTNTDLDSAVARGAFREDLFYRLNVVPLEVLPLRERPQDVAPIAARLLSQLALVHRTGPLRLSPEAVAALSAYAFPGNVRELRNLLERALVGANLQHSGSQLSLEDLPLQVRSGSGNTKAKPSLADLERQYIAEILDYTRGKKSKAAAILGITRKTLLEKRKKYGI